MSLNSIAVLFSSRSSTPFIIIAFSLIGLSIVTERVSDDRRLGFVDDIIFVAKLSRVRN